jgi:hypothetical protein
MPPCVSSPIVDGALVALTRPLHAPVFTDSVRPVIDAGLVEPVEADTALTRDVHLKIAPQP